MRARSGESLPTYASVGLDRFGSFDTSYRLAQNVRIASCFSYVLLKSDVVLRAITGDVLRYFEGSGLQLVDFRCGRMNELLYQSMYQDAFLWPVDYWSHNLKAYEFGPVIGLMLWDATAWEQGRRAQESIAARKGSALPSRLLSTTIRGQFKAASRVFNVLHAPDNVEAALRESCIWFGATLVRKVVNRWCRSGSRASTTEPLCFADRVCAEVKRQRYTSGCYLNGSATFIVVKLRAVHSILKRQQLPRATQRSLEQLYGDYDAAASNLFGFAQRSPDPQQILDGVRIAEERTLGSMITHALDPAHGSDHHPNVTQQFLQVVLALAQETAPRNAESTLQFLWYLLDELCVYTSELERFVIQTGQIYAR